MMAVRVNQMGEPETLLFEGAPTPGNGETHRYLSRVSLPRLREYVPDLIEPKRAELAVRNAQTEPARAARLTTMGEFVASIVHELNQPLAAIKTNSHTCLNWLDQETPDLDQARRAVARIVRDTLHASEVIRGLRALAMRSGPQPVELGIDEIIQDVLALTHSELERKDVRLEADLAAGGSTVLGNKVLLEQVLLNLIMNGVEAMTESDQPRVLSITSRANASAGVLVRVADTGVGLDAPIMDRLFEPFFTTKDTGMGMGLSICRSIIDAHGGRIWAEPNLPRGAVFQFTLEAKFGKPD
jgi:C4-dicarboxylate-specific signal transduction histidine kinase